MNKKVEEALNLQVDKEMYSSHLYMAMASWAETAGFKGTSEWLYAQAEEERNHMIQFIQYINGRGGKTIIPKINQPPQSWDNIKQLFEQVLEHERYITNSINEIVAICTNEKDFTTLNWIQLFVNEQIEEEETVNDILDKLNLIGDNNMYMFDRDIMSMRTKTAN